MTLGQCLEEIKKIYLNGDVEAMTKLGIGLIHELKNRYFPSPYPKSGWLVYCLEEFPCLIHKNMKIVVRISFDENQEVLSATPIQHSKEDNLIYFPNQLQ